MEVYAVILHRFEDLEDFYNDMETDGGGQSQYQTAQFIRVDRFELENNL